MKNGEQKSQRNEEANIVAYVLGQLPQKEEELFEHSLLEGGSLETIAELEEAFDTLTAVAEEIAAKMPAPRRGLKDKVMKAAIQISSGTVAISDHQNIENFVIRSNQGLWQETGFPGVTLKMLHQVQGSDRSTVLVRIAAGARYPEHRHVGYEECLVVEGDLHINGVSLVAGDFILTHDDTEHHDTYSDHGCVLLLSTQLEDEVLER